MASARSKKLIRKKFDLFNEMAKSVQNEGFDNVPRVMSDKEISELIDRMSQKDISRMHKAFNKAMKHDAGEMAITDGETMPMFMRVMIDELVNYTNWQRAEIRAAFPTSIEDPIWVGTRTSGKNLQDIKGQYYTADDLIDLFDVSIANYDSFIEMYVAVMIENGYSEDTINQVIELYKNDPVRFRTIMESNSNEIELNYIYVSSEMANVQFVMTSTGLHRVGVSADQTNFNTRKDNVELFWLLRSLEYENNVSPFTYTKV